MQERKKKSEENYLIYIQFIKFNAKKFPREGKRKKKKKCIPHIIQRKEWLLSTGPNNQSG